MKELGTPISEKDFLAMIRDELPEMTEAHLREHVRKKFREASANGQQMTKWDVYHSKIQLEMDEGCKDDDHWKWAVSTQEMRDRGEPYILPKDITLTPLPDSSEYDPEDFYNLRDDMSLPIRPNLTRKPQWFDRPKKWENTVVHDELKLATEVNWPKTANEQLENSMMKKERREFYADKHGFYRNYERPELDMIPMRSKDVEP